MTARVADREPAPQLQAALPVHHPATGTPSYNTHTTRTYAQHESPELTLAGRHQHEAN